MSTSEQTKEIAKRPAPAPSQPTTPDQAPQYVNGFEGMATQPFPKDSIAALTAPIDPSMVEVKPDGIVYLPGVFYRQRLTEAFGPGGWSLAPRGPARVMGNVVTYHGALYCLGRFVSEAVGENAFHATNENMSYASALEGARTDCITRCCKDLLVAKELWNPGWRTTWLEQWALKAWLSKEQIGGQAKKGKWIHWRKDRAVPWQVKQAGARAQPAVSSPEPEEDGGPKTSAPRTGPASTARGMGPIAAGAGDTGEAADTSDLDELERLVFQELRWKKMQASNWLSKRFGMRDPAALSKQQLTDAFSLLFAWRQGKDAYAAKIAELEGAGRIRKEAA